MAGAWQFVLAAADSISKPKLFASFHHMNRKTKKRMDVLRARLQKLQQSLAGVKKQLDHPDEAAQVDREIETVRQELSALANVRT